MSERETRAQSEDLQFDRVVTEARPSSPPSNLAVTCTACQALVETEYYDVNGNVVCGSCRSAIEAAAETPRGMIPLITAGVFGLGAGIVGAAIYYAVIAITSFEIGIVAILIGYMVGYAVRKGVRGRGGLRFQVLAAALTYAAVGLAYTPIVVKAAIDAERTARMAASPATSSSDAVAAADSTRAETTRPGWGSLLPALALLTAMVAALPVLAVVGSLPGGVITALIIFVGMRQAWKMTGAPWLQVLGPYRVGAQTSTPT